MNLAAIVALLQFAIMHQCRQITGSFLLAIYGKSRIVGLSYRTMIEILKAGTSNSFSRNFFEYMPRFLKIQKESVSTATFYPLINVAGSQNTFVHILSVYYCLV